MQWVHTHSAALNMIRGWWANNLVRVKYEISKSVGICYCSVYLCMQRRTRN
jgi:hypothetical protein